MYNFYDNIIDTYYSKLITEETPVCKSLDAHTSFQ